MDAEHFKIAVVGAGHAGIELLKKLFEADFVDIVGVVDTNDNAPGMLLAREHQIVTTTNMNNLLVHCSDIDIIIDVTGIKAVRDALRAHMQESGNYHTVIMHERISALLLSLFSGEKVATKASDDFY